MLVYSGANSDGEAHVIAVDKATGEEIARVPAPRNIRYGMMTYMHEGRQYIVVQMNGGVAAMALPS
jgi:hypothetical protein